jgi:hypothetical protein
MDYKKKNMSTDWGKGRGNKRARVTRRGSPNPKHCRRKHNSVHNLAGSSSPIFSDTV